ncbi:nitroreductase family deazaflavin-dependent oxidoreductase [Patulibacter defluvii]|uniref:nitroreductase family deazaflavin-dependent oxidoreductase n=1 Tax=Patulibacter defluvii TaxID=3095358 RepID=UPI002A758DD3|nr:nitroreductase family deazaflavin-dependent oxidoreductase [Patulibacter sp. DM4]
MILPRAVARFNKHVSNPIQRNWAWLLPPWATIRHLGRRSGRPYLTPVVALRSHGGVAIALVYGERSDWVRNVLAGGGELTRRGRRYRMVDPRVVDADDRTALGPLARSAARVPGRALVCELEPLPGGGRPRV